MPVLGFSLNEALLLDRGIPQRKALRKKVLNISEGGSVIYRKRLFNTKFHRREHAFYTYFPCRSNVQVQKAIRELLLTLT